MPTRQQIEAVIEQIKKLQSAHYGHPDAEGFLPTDMGDLIIPGDEGIPWSGVSSGAQGEALAYLVDWEGFSESQRDDVIERVRDGEDTEFWMDGVEADAASPQRPSSDGATRMADTKHTPGPWVDDGNGMIYGRARGDSDEAPFVADVRKDGAGGFYSNEEMANARLIAASPKLLSVASAALERMGKVYRDTFDSRMDHDPLVIQLRVAIAEATPGASLHVTPAERPTPSITAAILDNPKAFLPESGNGQDHGNDRGR